MRKQILSFICFITLALHAAAVVPTNGLPILMRSGDYDVQVSPAQAWTPFSISYKGTKLGLDNGYYGTVIRKDAVTFTGSGHTEGGAELVTNLIVVVDGVSQGEPVPGATYSGTNVTLTKLSRVDQSDERWVLEVSPDGIHEAVSLTAVETQSMIGMYAFMHPLFTNTTEWVAEDDSVSYEGDCLSDGDWELNEDILWVALYSPGQQLGVHISYPEIYSGVDKKTGIWDLAKYHKVYFQPFGTETFAPGTTHSWEMDFQCFESSPANWKDDARALSSATEPTGSSSGIIEAVQDHTACDLSDVGDGSGDTLSVRGNLSAKYARKTWMQFDLSNASYDQDASATLSVTYAGAIGNHKVKFFAWALNSGFTPLGDVLGTDWLEGDLDWANAPGNDTNQYFTLSSDTAAIGDWDNIDQSMTITNGQVLTFNMARVGDFVQADGRVTLMMSAYDVGAGVVYEFASSENLTFDGPMLLVQGASFPELPPPEDIVSAVQDHTACDLSDVGDGSGDTLSVRGNLSAKYARKIWMKFDLNDLSYDPDALATLLVTYAGGTGNHDVKFFAWALNSGFAPSGNVQGTDWVEGALDWANAPGNDTNHYFTFSSDTVAIGDWNNLDQAMTLTHGQTLSFDIAQIGDFVQADGSVTLMMSAYDVGAGVVYDFASSENLTFDGPMLRVEGASSLEISNPEILSVVSFSGTVMELTVSCNNPTELYPKTAAELTGDTVWSSAGHSTNGNAPFVVTNLGYSAVSGPNFVVYVEADMNQKFFTLGSE